MKHSTLAFLFVAVLAQQAQAAAGVYKCVKHREVSYQSEPCPMPIRRTEPNIKKLNEERMKRLLETTVAPVQNAKTPVTPVPAPVMPEATFKCDGRKYCSQMTSCEEAKFFLDNCPGAKMDNHGNGNGIPCERQWCKRRN